MYLVAPNGRGGVAARRLGAHEGVRAAAEHALAATSNEKKSILTSIVLGFSVVTHYFGCTA